MKPKHIIFYSWQSDLSKETNQNAIRHSLREASNLLENEITETQIILDEATRDKAGSPNIPDTIFDKIESCDIYICDLTTINTDAPSNFRKTPNPNVLIELGFAINSVGWDRIILLFNEIHGIFPTDLPFDIDRHRATPFKIKDKKDSQGKKQLALVLKEAIQKIILDSPLRPNEKKKLTPEQQKRKNDIQNLKWAISAIHIPTFDHFIEELPEKIYVKIFYFKDWFSSILDSSTFFIYDQELLDRLTEFKINWNDEKPVLHFHHIEIAPSTMLDFGLSENPFVTSVHHQSVKKTGKNFRVIATSPDKKVVEAISNIKFKNVYGVQFHPEFSTLYKQKEFRDSKNNTVSFNDNDKQFLKYFWKDFSLRLYD